jgi:hypothetical protein
MKRLAASGSFTHQEVLPDKAIEMYKERRVRDAHAPVGSTDFDELDASDSDAEESDDDTATIIATTLQPIKLLRTTTAKIWMSRVLVLSHWRRGQRRRRVHAR